MRSGLPRTKPAASQSKPEQLKLCFVCQSEEARLREQLESTSGRAVKLAITENATSLMSVREKGSILIVRLHRMFLDAGDRVIAELGAYIRTRRGKTPKFWEFVNSNRSRIAASRKRRTRLVQKGNAHDLAESFGRMNAEYFGGELKSGITWGSRGKPRARGRTLGSYCQSSDLIRIHPSLDRRGVPRYYLDFVVYHEMLHAWLMRGHEAGGSTIKSESGTGRRREIHGARFKALERKYKDYARAIAWERG